MATTEQTNAAIQRVGTAISAGRTPNAADLTITERAAQNSGDQGNRAGRALGNESRGSWGVFGS